MNRAAIKSWAIVAFIISAGSVLADEAVIPETPAGKRAAAFIAALNNGDKQALREFEMKHRAKSAARRRPLEERVAHLEHLRADWGQLKVRNVLSSGEHDILVVVEPERGDGWVHLAFELEAEPPHGLVGIRVEGPIDPKSSEASNKRLDADGRRRVVERIADELVRGYVFEDVGQAMAADIRSRLAQGEYDGIEYSYPFAQRLTEDLRGICHDKHLRVMPRVPMTQRGERVAQPGDLAPRPEMNYGFAKIEVLPGNVGLHQAEHVRGQPSRPAHRSGGHGPGRQHRRPDL